MKKEFTMETITLPVQIIHRFFWMIAEVHTTLLLLTKLCTQTLIPKSTIDLPLISSVELAAFDQRMVKVGTADGLNRHLPTQLFQP